MDMWLAGELADEAKVAEVFSANCVTDASANLVNNPDNMFKVYHGPKGVVEWVGRAAIIKHDDIKWEPVPGPNGTVLTYNTYSSKTHTVTGKTVGPVEDIVMWSFAADGKVSRFKVFWGNQIETDEIFH